MTFVFDIDGTLCNAKKSPNGKFDYANAKPIVPMIEKLNKLYKTGHKIILFTARNMKTYEGNLELINRYTRPILEDWLRSNFIRYHELIMGKPWDEDIVYIDDRALTINQVLSTDLTYPTIIETFNKNKDLL